MSRILQWFRALAYVEPPLDVRESLEEVGCVGSAGEEQFRDPVCELDHLVGGGDWAEDDHLLLLPTVAAPLHFL